MQYATITAGDVLLASLKRHGIEHLFVNPGTDFPPIVEGLARAKESGTAVPRAVLAPHENLAVAMAHGAHLVTGAPQAIMVHVNVGTANTVNMLADASRDRIPLLLMAGRTPVLETGAFGARNRPIHWAQEMFDQAGMVRELVKWDYEMRSPEQAPLLVPRALEAALASPSGPVYLALPREPLSAPVSASARDGEIAPRAHPARPHPDPAAIDRLAGWIAEARRPLIITSNVGRAAEETEALAQLAERFKLPVAMQTPRFLCLPTDHPMHLGFDPSPFLADADLVLVIDCDVPWMPAVKAPGPETRIVHIGEDPAFLRYPMRSFRSDLSIAAGVTPALSALAAALAAGGVVRETAWCERPQRAAGAVAPHITPEYLSRCIGEMAGPDGVIVNEYQLRPDHCTRTRPGTYFAISPAGGLGWSVGAALGIKLAAPERFVVATIGDGGFVFANPTACHWAAEAHGLPIVMVVFNNGRYAAVRNATMSMFAAGAAGRENGLGLADLSPSPPFERIAEAHGAFAARVERPDELPAVLAAARAAVEQEGRHALVNVITPY
ncbi:MAG TPA: thiamine pyrophosphate-requiring protein [Hyphomicrobiaceae bacterium]|nr:thiamine pyrophosphate-requiring protein [Hyphomicrobiaceae bacterium]